MTIKVMSIPKASSTELSKENEISVKVGEEQKPKSRPRLDPDIIL
jgi:hypothetical protein